MQDFIPYKPPDLTSVNIRVSFGEYVDGGILLVGLAGDLPDGSLGSPDCRYIRQELGRAILAFEPGAVLVDFRQLEYRYGNALVDALQPLDGLPTAYIHSGNKDIVSLLGGGRNFFSADQEAAALNFIVREYEQL